MDWLAIIDGGIRYLAYVMIIIGLPTLIYLNKFLYNQSLKAKDDQIKLLEMTRYDRALDMINAQEELLNKERKNYENIISNLTLEKESKEKIIKEMQNSFERIEQQLKDESEKFFTIRIEHRKTGRYVSASDYKGVPVPDHLYKTKG